MKDDKVPTTDAAVFDAAAMLGQLAGNREIARLLVDSATAEIPEYFVALAQAVAADERQEAGRIVHTLKSLVAQVGGMYLAGLLRAADEALRRGAPLAALDLDRLRAEYARLAAALADWQGKT